MLRAWSTKCCMDGVLQLPNCWNVSEMPLAASVKHRADIRHLIFCHLSFCLFYQQFLHYSLLGTEELCSINVMNLVWRKQNIKSVVANLLIPNLPANNSGKHKHIFKNSYSWGASLSTISVEGTGSIREGACAELKAENGKWLKHSEMGIRGCCLLKFLAVQYSCCQPETLCEA